MPDLFAGPRYDVLYVDNGFVCFENCVCVCERERERGRGGRERGEGEREDGNKL